MKKNTALSFSASLLAMFMLISCVPKGNESNRYTNGKPHPAPNFSAPTLGGGTTSLADYQGKVIILDFWATWCPPCRMEMPGFQAIYEKYKDKGLVILAANTSNETVRVIKPFVVENHLTFPILFGPEIGKISRAYDAGQSIPVSFIIDRKGNIRDKLVGYHPVDDFEKKIKTLLEEK